MTTDEDFAARLAAMTPAELVEATKARHPSGQRRRTGPPGRRLPALVQEVVDAERAHREAQEARGDG
jgi:hypothetical protein